MKENILLSTKKEDISYVNFIMMNFHPNFAKNAKIFNHERISFKNLSYFFLAKNIILSIKFLHEKQLSFKGQNIENKVFFFFT